MSPEQARGEKLDARTDLFSFGLVMNEMATAKRAFREDTAAELHEAILNRAPVPARELNPALPPRLEEIINKALEKNREARYQSAAEVRTDLLRLKWEAEVGKSSDKAQARVAEPLRAISGSAEHHSIVVLPFTNLSSDPENEFFARRHH